MNSNAFVDLGEAGETAKLEATIAQLADVNQKNQYGCSALFMASLGGHTKCVEMLLDKGADPSQTEDFGNTPLHVADDVGMCRVTIHS
jgi:ankyrin repeat protein